MSTDREYDVVLWGATGYTGRLIAEHLAGAYGADGLDWAIAGRDREALEGLRGRLGELDPGCADLDVLLGDADDRASLDAIAERATVVCSAVGPYARYGTPMVEACLEAGTDYCDLAGEVQWLRRMVDEHHEAAREAGVRLVHACGFDSVPSDLGTRLLQERAEAALGGPCGAVDTYVRAGSLSLSGGTLAGSVEAARAVEDDPELGRVFADPRSLTGDGRSGGSVPRSPRTARRDEAAGGWTAPFVMAPINEKVVHRSNALLGHPWGESFAYREASPVGEGVRGAARAYGLTAALGLFNGLLSVGPTRRLLERYVLPEPGTGPDRETADSGRFRFRLVGRRSPDGGRVEVTVSADRDAYGATGWMAGEAAACLAAGEVDSPFEGGVLTPATGIGPPLADRLGEVGLEFSTDVAPAG